MSSIPSPTNLTAGVSGGQIVPNEHANDGIAPSDASVPAAAISPAIVSPALNAGHPPSPTNSSGTARDGQTNGADIPQPAQLQPVAQALAEPGEARRRPKEPPRLPHSR